MKINSKLPSSEVEFFLYWCNIERVKEKVKKQGKQVSSLLDLPFIEVEKSTM